MASTIKLKRSTTAGSVPSLSEGEVAVNLKDKILYVANSTVTFELARNTANNGLVLHDGSGNEIRVTAPALSSDYSFTLPQNNGTNEQFLQTNGSGTLTWATPGGGGNVNAINSPSDNQLAIWTDGTTIEGNTNLTYSPTNARLSTPGIAVTDLTQNRVVYVGASDVLTDSADFTFDGSTVTLGGAVDLSVAGNATITGDLTVSGTTTTIDVQTVAIEDPIVKFANNNTGDSTDIGFYGRTGSTYTAFFMDNDDSKIYKLVTGLTNEPTTAPGNIDLTGSSPAQLDCVIDGGTY